MQLIRLDIFIENQHLSMLRIDLNSIILHWHTIPPILNANPKSNIRLISILNKYRNIHLLHMQVSDSKCP